MRAALHTPRHGRRGARALAGSLLVAWLALAGAAMLPTAARAEEQPAILKAYGLDWIERVRDDAWPQPKAQRPLICLLDTGVDITPDTPADNPEGPIVARLALDGGTGFAQGTEWQHHHGTDMASIIAAPRNGWGTVGVFPQARIVSIRVTEGAATFMTPQAIGQGIRVCLQYGTQTGDRIAAVNISESNYEQRPADIGHWTAASAAAEGAGATVVAATGNDPDATSVAPLAVDAILAVSAGDDDGGPCASAAALSQPGAIRGPGCSRSRSWPAGSSAATASISALAAALVSLVPARSPAEVRAALRAAAVEAVGGGTRLAAQSFSVGFPLVPLAAAGAPSSPVVLPSLKCPSGLRSGARASKLRGRAVDCKCDV